MMNGGGPLGSNNNGGLGGGLKGTNKDGPLLNTALGGSFPPQAGVTGYSGVFIPWGLNVARRSHGLLAHFLTPFLLSDQAMRRAGQQQ